MKFKVIKDCVLSVKKGSIVEIDDNQYKYAKAYLEEVEEPKKAVKRKKEK